MAGNDQRAVRGRPGQARLRRLARVAEHGSGRQAAGIALDELLAVALRGGVHLGLQLAVPSASEGTWKPSTSASTSTTTASVTRM